MIMSSREKHCILRVRDGVDVHSGGKWCHCLLSVHMSVKWEWYAAQEVTLNLFCYPSPSLMSGSQQVCC